MLKEQVINQIDTLSIEELMLIYGYIELLKGRPQLPSGTNKAHLQVREALAVLKNGLSNDILVSREERI
ncbi:hypothetical protein [Dyadobacter arcticus]|uniref:Uncharacterized protein n=1 Tax=Dyadobacter arcticus TaxID=1078754 RepID=A0ABX0UR58_9BACT|nr:hypothetical protein [Dyadobacter arcticus]NIJ54629.1 hypothetical protein [Dyadobacter arcticus]